MQTTSVLFIVSDFYHGGAQREMYEIDSAINKEKIEITILCLSNLNTSKYFPDYFYKKHLTLGTKIIFFKDIIKTPKKTIYYTILNKLKRLKGNTTKAGLFRAVFNKYDQIFFMGEYTYKYLERYVLPNDEGINIFIMSARFQGEHYRNINKKNTYNFFSPFDTKEQIDYEFSGFLNYTHSHFPLSLSIDKSLNKWKFQKKERKKIAIFTRLSKSKPLDPFFYAFHLLLKEMQHIELHIFGSGDYKEAEYDRYLNHLDLNNNVWFRGHQNDIKETLNNEDIDLVWFQGYLNRPAGYAGQDAILTGVPLLLWDFYLGENVNINKLNYVYPHFKDLNLFVFASKSVLLEEEIANRIAKRQYLDIVHTRDINKNIEKIAKKISHL